MFNFLVCFEWQVEARLFSRRTQIFIKRLKSSFILRLDSRLKANNTCTKKTFLQEKFSRYKANKAAHKMLNLPEMFSVKLPSDTIKYSSWLLIVIISLASSLEVASLKALSKTDIRKQFVERFNRS